MQYTSKEVYEFISKQTGDPIVERKICTISGQPFAIFQSDLDFYEKISPTFNGQKFPISTPTLCPEERQRRRLSFRNERKLYRRQCDASKKSIISIYSPDKPYKVYDQKIRRSDSRDPMNYGMDFDFSKTFTENFRNLSLKTPLLALVNLHAENSDYTNYGYQNKNCYLTFASDFNQECLYSNYLRESNTSIDCLNVRSSNKCYEVIDSFSAFQCTFSKKLDECTYCHYSINLKNCNYCFGCNNLHNKSYCINNIQYSQEEYHTITKDLSYDHNNTRGIYSNLNMIQCEGCFGDSITNCKNVVFGFDVNDIHSGKYVTNGPNTVQDYMDIDGAGMGSLSYYGVSIGGSGSSKNHFSSHIRDGSNNVLYSSFLINCNNCFGCISLRNKSYCIFNKQYTKEEYEIQVAKIIQHMMTTREWGEFFHPSLSPFGYNETVAQEYYYTSSPSLLLSEKGDHKNESPSLSGEGFGVRFEDLKIFGYKRSTYNADPSLPAGVQTIERKNYSDEQWDALLSQDNLETQVFLCSVSGRPYRLQKAEIEFYRKHHLPIPDKHPDIRHEEHMKLRPGRTLFLRNCDCCGKEMLSVYPVIARTEDEAIHNAQDMDRHAIARDDKEQKVYCEQCYQQEMYS